MLLYWNQHKEKLIIFRSIRDHISEKLGNKGNHLYLQIFTFYPKLSLNTELQTKLGIKCSLVYLQV